MRRRNVQRYREVEYFDTHLKELIWEAEAHTQAPLPIIWTSMLMTIASACQGRINVQTPVGFETSCNLYSMVIAESGERKTTVDKLFAQKLQNFNMQLKAEFVKEEQEYEAAYYLWKVKFKENEKLLKRSLSKGDQEKQIQFEKVVADLVAVKPKKPQHKQFLFNDITVDALSEYLSKYPSALLTSSDASYVFHHLRVDKLGVINDLWDGGTISINRKNSNPIEVINARLSMSLMIQPGILNQYSKAKNDLLRESGLLARVLMTRPKSTQGYRTIENIENMPKKEFDKFHAHIAKLIYETNEQINSPKLIMTFSTEAKQYWMEFSESVEKDIGDGAYLEEVKDCASKMPNNVARIAAILQYYLTGSEVITAENMRTATTLGNFYLEEFKEVFGVKTIAEEERYYGDILLNYLKKNVDTSVEYSKTYILQNGPRALRKRRELDMALYNLVESDFIRYFSNAKPAYFVVNF